MVVLSQDARGLVSRRIDMFEELPEKISERTDEEPYRRVNISVETRDGDGTTRSTEALRMRNMSAVPVIDNDITSANDLLGASYVGSTNNEAGAEHYKRGQYDQALHEFQSALESQHASIGIRCLEAALTLSNMGATYLQLGDYERAQQVLEESLALELKLAPKLSLASTLNNLGNCANWRGKLNMSLRFYRAALEDLILKGGNEQDLANALFNIGRLEIQLNHMDEAKNALEDAWKLTKQAYDQNHPFAAQILDLMGFVHLNNGDYNAAMVSFTKALGVFRRVYGPLHMDVANSLFNVSMVREAKGELRDAWESYVTTRDVYHRLGLDTNNHRYKVVAKSIARLEHAMLKIKKVKSAGAKQGRNKK